LNVSVIDIFPSLLQIYLSGTVKWITSKIPFDSIVVFIYINLWNCMYIQTKGYIRKTNKAYSTYMSGSEDWIRLVIHNSLRCVYIEKTTDSIFRPWHICTICFICFSNISFRLNIHAISKMNCRGVLHQYT
jgi:hypothetical protein